MNDLNSLLMVTGVLGVGTLGFFMYKSNNPDKKGKRKSVDDESSEYNEKDVDFGSFFNLFKGGDGDNKEEKERDEDENYEKEVEFDEDDDEDEEPMYKEPKKRSASKTSKSRKSSSGTKRRY